MFAVWGVWVPEWWSLPIVIVRRLRRETDSIGSFDMTAQNKGRRRVPGPLNGVPKGSGGRIPGPQNLSFDWDDFSDVLEVFKGPAVRLIDHFVSPGGSGLPSMLRVNGMDEQGEQILATYLYGGGDPVDVDDPEWQKYMMAHENLRGTLVGRVGDHVRELLGRKQTGESTIFERFHYAFPENSGYSGYALLHGSNKTVGDFEIGGFADVSTPPGQPAESYDLAFNLRYTFNDIVDPNADYFTDVLKSIIVGLVTVGSARNYKLAIHFAAKCSVQRRPGRQDVFSGYPFDKAP
jgi:hypothetical protein